MSTEGTAVDGTAGDCRTRGRRSPIRRARPGTAGGAWRRSDASFIRGRPQATAVLRPPWPHRSTRSVSSDDPLPRYGRFLKRALDIALSVVGMVVFLPLVLAALLAVKLDTRGPAFFSQIRVGQNGKRFRMLKLRTMVHNNNSTEHEAYVRSLICGEADRHGGVFKLIDDCRVTRVGRVLRRLSIDELPQLWNVLRGDMSLVGPRPPLPNEVELYDAAAWQRLRVKPGVTGLWQVSGRCRLSFQEMVRLDVEYWKTWSMAADIRILCRTARAVLAGDGAG